MKAFILAAGLGTRLRPFTTARAKPALPVVGIPTLWFGAWHIKRELGISQLALNVSHLPETVREAAQDADLSRATGVRFHFSDESDQVLGSSGALVKLGAAWIGDQTLVVSNGDSICFPSWKRMLEFHRKAGAALTLHVREFAQAAEAYTNINVESDGRISSFGAKERDGIMFSGCYLFEPSLLSRLPAGVSELRPSLLEPLAKEGKLYAYREDCEWFDTGTVTTYAQTQFELLKKLPACRDLIEMKMREEAPGCWVPRNWLRNSGKPALQAPAIMTGDQSRWAAAASVFGPSFIGIEPPMPGISPPTQKAVVLAAHFEKLK